MRYACVALCLIVVSLTLQSSAQNPTGVAQVGQFTAPNLGFQSFFGTAAISPGTIAVSAPNDDLVYGALYVYEKPSTGWGTMGPTAMIYDQACNLGSPLAISNDGTIVAASLGGCYGGLGTSGASVGVFVKPTSGWQTVNTSTAVVGNIGGSGHCGYNFTMSSDGKTIACTDFLPWVHKRYLYLFTEPSGGWANLVLPTSSIQLTFDPWTVALNGSTVALANSTAGTLEVYQRTSGGIKHLATLSASDGAFLGGTILMDNHTIAVSGAVSGDSIGKVYVFSKPLSGWSDATETAQLSVPNLPNYSYFGFAMALSNQALLIGGRATSAAYMFLEPAGGWQTTSQPNITLLSNDPNQGAFGDAIAMQGTTIIVGDMMEGAQSNQNGAAYIYQLQ